MTGRTHGRSCSSRVKNEYAGCIGEDAPLTPDELRDRILRWEDPHTDFKEAVDNNSELAKDLVCFANSDGGQLVVGVAKDRSVVGVPDTDQLLLRVDDVAFQNCSPSLTVVPEIVTLDGKDVVVLNIAKGDQRPYSTRECRYYVRSGARCRRASREELLRLFQAAHSLFYDEQPLPRLDPDLNVVTRYLEDTNQVDLDEDLVRLLRAWRMYDGSHPTVGGLVLFGRRPQSELESSRVAVGALAGDDIGDDFVDRKDDPGTGRHVTVVMVKAGYAVHAVWHNKHFFYYIRAGRQSREVSPEESDYAAIERAAFRGPLAPLMAPSGELVEPALVDSAVAFVRRTVGVRAELAEGVRRVEIPGFPPNPSAKRW